MKKEEYKVMKIRIGKTEETKRLYALERERNDKVMECAREWSKLVKVDEKDFWTIAISTALYDLLDSIDHKAGLVACKKFLEENRGNKDGNLWYMYERRSNK